MNSWETILTVTYPHEAHVVKGYLESKGIEVKLKDELTAQVYNFYSNAIGGVKIQVKTSDFGPCLKLLQQGGFIQTASNQQSVKVEMVPKDGFMHKKECPFCASTNIAKKRDPNLLAVIVFMLLGILFPIFKSGYQCFDCGKQWKYVKRNS